MTLSGECIEEIVFSGDFFGIQPVAGLEDALRGKRLANLPAIDPAPFIAGMTQEELVALLVSEAYKGAVTFRHNHKQKIFLSR